MDSKLLGTLLWLPRSFERDRRSVTDTEVAAPAIVEHGDALGHRRAFASVAQCTCSPVSHSRLAERGAFDGTIDFHFRARPTPWWFWVVEAATLLVTAFSGLLAIYASRAR